MTVRSMAKADVLKWLEANDGNQNQPEPVPEPGMHPLALAEWMAGAAEAKEAFERRETIWEKWEDRAVWTVKTVLILVALSAVVLGAGTPAVWIPAALALYWMANRWLF